MKNKTTKRLRKFLEIEENIPLKKHTTFKIGGPARYFYKAENEDNLIKAVNFSKELSLPFFILGKGSNLLVSEKGFKGMVIKCEIKGIDRKDSKVKAGAGLKLSELIAFTAKNGLTGLEWAAGIPGTVGGAIRGNAGAFGTEMKDSVEEVEVIDSETLEVKHLDNKGCNFNYRNSIFKSNPNLIIISSLLSLKKEDKRIILDRIKNHKKYRKEHHPLEFPSSGSVFQNVDYNSLKKEIKERFPDIKQFKENEVIPVGFLIERVGLKGRKVGQAQISEKHANFIINLGGAKAKEVKELIELVKKKVKERFEIELKEEIQYLGF